MTARRVLPLLVGLWAFAAGAQETVTATASFPLDGGIGFARAYLVTSGGVIEYAMANAGESIQVFQVGTNAEGPSLQGQYATFAVADNITVSTLETTLVVAANVGPSCPTVCLDIFFWDPVGGFVKQASAPTNFNAPTAMTIDATASTAPGGLIHIFVFAAPTTLYRQDISLTASSVTVVGIPVGIPAVGNIQGLTAVGSAAALFASDNASNLYIYPEDGGPGVPFSTPSTGDYAAAAGLFYYPQPFFPPPGGSPYLLAGGGTGGIYALNPAGGNGPINIGSVQVLTADGGRATQPTGVAVDAQANNTVITEDNVNAEVPHGPWLHLILGLNLFPDGGAPDGGGVTTPDGGSIPTIPIIAPGPGALPGTTNSCNCSTAGSAPVLLALLLPLLIPRRRR